MMFRHMQMKSSNTHALRMNRTGCCAGISSLLSDLWILVALPLLEVQLQLLSQLLVPCEQVDLRFEFILSPDERWPPSPFGH